MNNRKTSEGFAKVSIKVLKYVVMIVVAVFCATAAYNYGIQIFNSEGMEPKPGTDMTITVEEGTSIKELGNTLEEYQIIKDSKIFQIQSYIYQVKSVTPGTYTFNTSENTEEILKVISAGPEDSKEENTEE